MTITDGTDYGPLTGLLGTWQGNRGIDIAPSRSGPIRTDYSETLIFTGKGTVKNAGAQQLTVVHYHQTVQRIGNGETFHDETGYWMWDDDTGTVMHSLLIPRGVCVLAGGKFIQEQNRVVLQVSAALGDPEWRIIESPFMHAQASTTAFHHHVEIDAGKLVYQETTHLLIYGKPFEHSDENELNRVA